MSVQDTRTNTATAKPLVVLPAVPKPTNGTDPKTVTIPIEELQKFQAMILQAIGANMKRMLVVNDMCAIETRNLMRESVLNEMNNLNRLAVAQLERLCTLDSSKESNANAQP